MFIPPNSPFYLGVEGDYVMRLPCTAVGFPKPSVSWIVDQVVVGKGAYTLVGNEFHLRFHISVEFMTRFDLNSQPETSSYLTSNNDEV